MTQILLALALAGEMTPAQLKQDAIHPQRYLYGVAQREGKVSLNLIIDDQGKVRSVKALEGHPELVDAARRMAFDYRYTPAQVDGRATASELRLEIHFRRL
jgi:TonB family protein